MRKNITILSLIFIAFLAMASEVEARIISTCTSAILKGSISTTRDNPTTVWFEWGEGRRERNDTYSNATYSQTLTRSGNFSELLTGLSPNTTYYYRAIAQNRDGVTVGDIETFTTNDSCGSSSASTQVIVREVPVVRTVYVPAATNRVASANTAQAYRTTRIATSSGSDSYANQSTYQPDLRANVSPFSSSFSLIQALLLIIFIFLITLLVKRVLLSRAH